MKYILGGHWTSAPEGWTVLKEEDQDITAPLGWEDDEVDALFTEHVLEHIPLTEGILFFKEAFRVLKRGGIIRTVCPMVEKIAVYSSYHSRDYAKTSLSPYFSPEVAALGELGVDFVTHSHPFLLHSLIKFHHHKFVWSASLMVNVLERIGFSEVCQCEPGQSFMDKSICLERKVRGLSEEYIKQNDVEYFDCESLAIEARK